MPRKASDKIITHRIEFSPKERELVDSIINTQKENQRLDAITSTLNAAGVAIGGSGALIAALGLAAWFGFDVKDKAKNAFNDLSDTVTDVTSRIVTGRSVEENVNIILESSGLSPDERTRLKEKVANLRAEEARFCNPNSQYYDSNRCAEIKVEIEQTKQEYYDLIDRAKKAINPNEDGSIPSTIRLFERYFNPFSRSS